jgi:Rrf2 family protein
MALGHFPSQRFGYAVHTLAYMAKKPPGKLSTLPEVAGWIRTLWPSASEMYLSNVMQQMARGGLLRGHRGVTGGYSLAHPSDEITLRDVCEVCENIELERCSLCTKTACTAQGNCSLQNRLREVEEGYLEAMEKVTIASLTQEVVTDGNCTLTDSRTG